MNITRQDGVLKEASSQRAVITQSKPKAEQDAPTKKPKPEKRRSMNAAFLNISEAVEVTESFPKNYTAFLKAIAPKVNSGLYDLESFASDVKEHLGFDYTDAKSQNQILERKVKVEVLAVKLGLIFNETKAGCYVVSDDDSKPSKSTGKVEIKSGFNPECDSYTLFSSVEADKDFEPTKIMGKVIKTDDKNRGKFGDTDPSTKKQRVLKNKIRDEVRKARSGHPELGNKEVYAADLKRIFEEFGQASDAEAIRKAQNNYGYKIIDSN